MSLENLLANLNENYTNITSLIPNIYYFYDENGNNEINDGGNDMYDGANQLQTNRNQVYYTHTVAENNEEDNGYTNPPMDGQITDGETAFNNGSQYFTNMYPGLFVMAATNCDIQYFQIEGNVGSDGSGQIIGGQETINYNDTEYTYFYKFSGETDDPSVNHIIIIPGDGTGITHEFEENNSDDDHDKISGNISELYYLLVARRDNQEEIGNRLSTESANEIVLAFLALLDEISYTFEVVTYNLIEIVNICSKPDSLEHILYSLNNSTVTISDSNLNRRILKHGDQFTVTGEQATYLKETFVDGQYPLLKII